MHLKTKSFIFKFAPKPISSVLLLVFNKIDEKMLFIKFILHERRPKFFQKKNILLKG